MSKKKFYEDIFIVAIVSTIIICISMRIWEMNFNIPTASGGDGLLGEMLVRSIKENGLKGLWFNYRIGSPEYSSLIDTPFLDYVIFFEEWILTRVFSSTATLYLVYILSFPFAAVSMCVLLHYIKINRYVVVLLSVLYSVTPYHFIRGMGHLTLSNYYMLPIGILLAMLVLEEEFVGMFPIRYKNDLKNKILMFSMIVILGLSNVYYSFFSMLIILIAVVYKMVNKKTLKPLYHEMRIFVCMALFFLLGLLPKVAYSIINGKNSIAGTRPPSNTEVYALKIIQMLLPPTYTRVEPLQRIAETYRNSAFNVNENQAAALGILASVGFVISCVWFVYKYSGDAINCKRHMRLLDYVSVTILVLILYSTAGGFGTIFSYLVTPEIRCLNRVSILIVALCIVVMAITMNYLSNKINIKRFYLISSILFIGILYVEVPINPEKFQDYTGEKDRMYTEFFDNVENVMNEEDSIYQLPMNHFPEAGGIYNMEEYTLFLGYLYTDNLKWSYGGTKGREDRAMELYIDEGRSVNFVEEIVNEGFDGVCVFTKGLEDGGVMINEFYQKVMGLEPIVSEDNEIYFYKLTK